MDQQLEDSLILTLSLDDDFESAFATSMDVPIRREKTPANQEKAAVEEGGLVKVTTRKNAVNLQRMRFQELSKKLADFANHTHRYEKVNECTKDGCDMCDKKYGDDAMFECEYAENQDSIKSHVSMCNECSKDLSLYYANVIHKKAQTEPIDPTNLKFVRQWEANITGFEIGLYKCQNCEYTGPVISYNAIADYSEKHPDKITHRWTQVMKQTIHLCPQCNHQLKDQLMAPRTSRLG